MMRWRSAVENNVQLAISAKLRWQPLQILVCASITQTLMQGLSMGIAHSIKNRLSLNYAGKAAIQGRGDEVQLAEL